MGRRKAVNAPADASFDANFGLACDEVDVLFEVSAGYNDDSKVCKMGNSRNVGTIQRKM